MKVALIPSWYNSDTAPTRGSFVRDQAVALSERGLTVIVIVFDRDAVGPLFKIRRSVESGMIHIRVAVPAPMHRLLGFYAPLLLAEKLVEILDVEAPDVVHAHAVRPAGVVAALAMAKLRLPWCLTEHSSPLKAFWYTPHGRRQIARAYSASHRLFGVSNSLVREMRHFFPRSAAQVELLYNGIDTDVFRAVPMPIADMGCRLLFVGGLVNQKAIPDLLRAVHALPPEMPWTLSIVGVGPLEGSLRDLAQALGIADRLNWLGAVPHEEVPQIFSKHDLLVVPSRAETFSLVSAEALACGIPVVATRCGGPEEVIGPLGLPLVPVGQPSALAQAITHMLANLSGFDRAGAVESVRDRFSMKSLAAKLETIYADMVREAV